MNDCLCLPSASQARQRSKEPSASHLYPGGVRRTAVLLTPLAAGGQASILSANKTTPVRVILAYSPLVWSISRGTESDFTGTIQAGRHEQVFIVVIQLVVGGR